MPQAMLRTTVFLGFVFVLTGGQRGDNGIEILRDCNYALNEGKTQLCNPRTIYPKVQYERGNINLIFAVPHNGNLKPINIKDRRDGCEQIGAYGYWLNKPEQCRYGEKNLSLRNCRENSKCKIANIADKNTQKIAKLAREELSKLTNGKTPFLVVSNLYRAKMDPNRPKEEAAQGNRVAEGAFDEYHQTIENIKKEYFNNQPGLLIDFHGQAHKSQLIEIGYLVKKDELRQSKWNNTEASPSDLAKELSIWELVSRQKARIEDYLFGPKSLGAYFNMKRYEAVPSPEKKYPGRRELYFRGGYSIAEHGSNVQGNVDGIQLEFPSKLRKDSKLKKFSKDLAVILKSFYYENYGYESLYK